MYTVPKIDEPHCAVIMIFPQCGLNYKCIVVSPTMIVYFDDYILRDNEFEGVN